jgi:thiamine biosynthesis lipoprotein
MAVYADAGPLVPPFSVPAPGGGLRRVEALMGTVVSIDVREPVGPDLIDAAFLHLRDIDARFSPYRPDSEVSRLGRGELAESATSPDLREVLALCEDLRRTSGGAFDIQRHRADGRLDPSGLVKGWAVEAAVRILGDAGVRSFAIDAGGDVMAVGEPEPGRPWRVGIRHPDRPDRVAAVLAIRDRAVATSAAYERGDHVRDGRTREAAGELLSVTVIGPSLAWADAYATTAFAMGREGIRWVTAHPGYDIYAIVSDRAVVRSAGLDDLLL